MWGWNLNGQMAHALHEPKRIEFADGSVELIKHKRPSVFAFPEIVTIIGVEDDEQFQIKSVYCGARHTIVRTECDQYFACGWNKYGQIGSIENGDNKEVIDCFRQINFNLGKISNIICGSWTTIVIFN